MITPTAPAPVSVSGPTLGEIVGTLEKVSGHREVLLRLNRVIANENAGARDLVDVLRLDAGLTTRVIFASNTVLFRGGMPVASVEEAVVRVGFNEVRRLLLASIAYELTCGAMPAYGLAPGDLWNRSLAAALSMDALAEEAHRSADVCHTIGLVHMLGTIAIDAWMRARDLARGGVLGDPFSDDVLEREREAVGFTHAEVGAALLEGWGFPESITATVRHQYAPLAAPRFSKLACLLCAARWMMRVITSGENAGNWPGLPADESILAAGLRPERVPMLVDPVAARFAREKAALGML